MRIAIECCFILALAISSFSVGQWFEKERPFDIKAVPSNSVYTIEPTSARWSDAIVSKIYHDKFEYEAGVLTVQKPLKIINATGIPIQVCSQDDWGPCDIAPTKNYAPINPQGRLKITGATPSDVLHVHDKAANKETTRTYDGCNWTICEKGTTGCAVTVVACTVTSGGDAETQWILSPSDLMRTQSFLAQVPPQADPSPTIGSTRWKTVFIADQFSGLLPSVNGRRLGIGTTTPQHLVEAASPATVCGVDQPSFTPNIDLLQISCVDYEALRKIAPHVPWPAGTRTQVLVHVRAGEAVRVTVGGVTKFEDIITDAWGRRVSMVQFDGINHTAVDVKILAEIK